ncbi:TnsA endonuclease [Clostridiales bacterium oral taxon 876 str. F0540]|nr:TnsA endonuclease [Clostridiales bacterium oral taxon 876 str. F0540]
MRKDTSDLIPQKYKKHFKEGRGLGEGVGYIPWIKINEFSSKGRATRIMGIKTNRIHHLHSDNQLRTFLIFEWSDKVVDIRECYPLLDLMKVIDDKKNLFMGKFTDKQTGDQLIITTSFLITLKETDGTKKYIARAVKSSPELCKKITMEKLEIERRYWEAKNIDFKVITDKELNRQLCKNIQWVREAFLDNLEVVGDMKSTSELLYFTLFNNQDIAVNEVIKGLEKRNELDRGMALYVFRYLLAIKKIKVDMTKSIDLKLIVKKLVIFPEEE